MDLNRLTKIKYSEDNKEKAAIMVEYKERYTMSDISFLTVSHIRYYGDAIEIIDTPDGYIGEIKNFNKDRAFLNRVIRYQVLTKQAVGVGELIHDKLREFISYVDTKGAFSGSEESYRYIGDKQLKDISFMDLREEFKKYLKVSTIAHKNEKLNTAPKRNALSKLLHHFITDRNLYTHGFLVYLIPDHLFVVEGKDIDTGNIAPFNVTEECITSFSNVAEYLYEILKELGSTYLPHRDGREIIVRELPPS